MSAGNDLEATKGKKYLKMILMYKVVWVISLLIQSELFIITLIGCAPRFQDFVN